MSFWEKNLAALKRYRPELYDLVTGFQQNADEIEVFAARNLSNTVKVTYLENGDKKNTILHSKYNPELEGAKFAQEVLSEKAAIYGIYGFAFGYHIDALRQGLPAGSSLIIFEQRVDIFMKALENRDLNQILMDPNVNLVISADYRNVGREIAKLISSKEPFKIACYMPAVNILDEKLGEFKYFLLELNLRKSISDALISSLEQNYEENRHNITTNVGVFFQKFQEIPIVIVCAGPSLDKNMHLLGGIKDKAIIICVSKALKPLLNKGITPHFIISIDPGEETCEQIQGLENLDIPFIILATACGLIGRKYKGPKFIACQYDDYLSAEEKAYLIKTGGSVSTTALDIALRMGGNPIIFIGQDLAYTNYKHHCSDTVHEKIDVINLKNMRCVKGPKGEDIPATLGMISFKNWIENRVRNEKGTNFINATEGGAFIKGFNHISFGEAIRQFLIDTYDLDKIISCEMFRVKQ